MHRTTKSAALALLSTVPVATAAGCTAPGAAPPLSEAPASAPARISVLAYHDVTEDTTVVADEPAAPGRHRFCPCRCGQDAATYQASVKSDVARGLGAVRSAFGLPDGWQGSTYTVPWDDHASAPGASAEPDPDPWLGRYLASQFPVVFVQESYTGADNRRYRLEAHNPVGVDQFRTALDTPRFDRPDGAG